MIDAEQSDLFDVLAYIAFALAPITREERVNNRREQIFSRYDNKRTSGAVRHSGLDRRQDLRLAMHLDWNAFRLLLLSFSVPR